MDVDTILTGWATVLNEENAGGLQRGLRRRDDVLADRVQHVRAVEQSLDLVRGAPVRDVPVLDDVVQRSPAMVLADDVLRDPLLVLRSRRKERERTLDRVDEPHLATDCIVAS